MRFFTCPGVQEPIVSSARFVGGLRLVGLNGAIRVANIDGLAQDYLDQGNDLRTSTAGTRVINGSLGVTAYKTGSQTVFLSRDPAGNLMTFRPTSGTSLYYLVEPNGNVAGATDPFGYLAAAYEYSPYGKTTTVGLGDFNPFRYLSSWQETTGGGAPGHYKMGARFYNTNGMFTQPDALTGGLGDPRTMTSYNYAGGDPINQADPSGYAFGPSDPICSTSTGYYVPDGCVPGAQPGSRSYSPAGTSFISKAEGVACRNTVLTLVASPYTTSVGIGKVITGGLFAETVGGYFGPRFKG